MRPTAAPLAGPAPPEPAVLTPAVFGLALFAAATLAAATLAAQRSDTVAATLRPPGLGGAYRATFDYQLLIPHTHVDEGGAIALAEPAVATYRFGGYAVAGPDPGVARGFTVRIELPGAAGASAVFLSEDLPEGYSASFFVRNSGRLDLPARLTYAYEGVEVQDADLDLGLDFVLPAGLDAPEAPLTPGVSAARDEEAAAPGRRDGRPRWWWAVGLGALGAVVLGALALARRRNRAAPSPVKEAVPPPRRTTTSEPTGMRITRRVDAAVSADFHPDLRPRSFCAIAMSALWTDSRVETVYLGYAATIEIDAFLRRHDPTHDAPPDGAAWERDASMPEIGGMLMGQCARAEGDAYRVSIEKFVPLRARYQSVIRVDLDPLSVARDLGEAQDQHPDLRVVGWFHTHPGHGLFLSPPDLKVQYNQFPAAHHLAMEIDPLSAHRDVSFFTYTSSGAMNNADSRREDTGWFSWTTLVAAAETYLHA